MAPDVRYPAKVNKTVVDHGNAAVREVFSPRERGWPRVGTVDSPVGRKPIPKPKK